MITKNKFILALSLVLFGFKAFSQNLINDNTFCLRLKQGVKEKTRIAAHNYYFKDDGSTRQYIDDVVNFFEGRSARSQARRNRLLTRDHGRHEMSFSVKNPETGRYDKIFEVPVSGNVVPLPEDQFMDMAASTGPVMRSLRKLLQDVYSHKTLDASSLGLEKLAKEDSEHVLSAIKESIYLEPQLIHPNMKDYPFLSVAGFDAVIGDPEKIAPLFFEFNLGTPSGLSNNIQLLENLRIRDQKLFETFADRLVADDSFAKLRQAVESNAQEWTKRNDGISVVVGPGEYNGAHPDVAMISYLSGMPLVRNMDLYQDAQGYIRLNTGKFADDPIVTGIYGRTEESFFLQSNKEGLAQRSPDYQDNEAIGKRLGHVLQNGIIYDFIYDEKEQIVGVVTENGKPRLRPTYDPIGTDPSRPNSPPGSFLKAIQNRKLYFSGLGGRVVDDKRIFQVVSEEIALNFMRDEKMIAKPPKTLKLKDYPLFYNSKELQKFVVKEPDKSGGSGVHLLANMSPGDRLKIVKMVEANPERYIVQEFVDPVVLTTTEKSPGGKDEYGTVVTDIRTFVYIDAKGKVSTGSQSMLVRTAAPEKAASNTSQGGGYGIGVVLKNKPQKLTAEPSLKTAKSVLPEIPVMAHISMSKWQDLKAFLKNLNIIEAHYAEANNATRLPDSELENLIESTIVLQRGLLEVLGRDASPFIDQLRALKNKKMNQAQANKAIQEFKTKLESLSYNNSEIRKFVLSGLKTPFISHAVSSEQLSKLLTLKKFEQPLKIKKYDTAFGSFEKFETGVYSSSDDKYVQEIIEALKNAGGEVRKIEEIEVQSGSKIAPGAYFFVTEAGVPIIGVNLETPGSLISLRHEHSHFKTWMAKVEEFKKQGLSEPNARQKAKEHQLKSEIRISDERKSIDAEFAAEKITDSVFNKSENGRATAVTQVGYIARISYPELEGLRDVLHKHKWSGVALDEKYVGKLLKIIIQRALKLREKGLVELAQKFRLEQNDRFNLTETYQHIQALKEKSLFEHILLYDFFQFESNGTLDLLQAHYLKVTQELGLKEEIKKYSDYVKTQSVIQNQ